MPTVNPELMIWARESADLDEDQACMKLHVTPLHLATLESGSVDPTPAMLETMASVYRRPLITFYLLTPPAKGDYGIDYRTPNPENISNTISADLKALLRNIISRQGMLKSELEDEEDAESISFVASQKMSAGIERLVAQLNEVVGIDLTQYYAMNGPDSAFDLLRDRAHRAGAFVLLDDDSETYETMIGLDNFRGFTIADSLAPFIVINGRVPQPVLSFTLLHELAHLILGNTGISGIAFETDVEKFCADVASNFLLPTGELETLPDQSETVPTAMAANIEKFASSRNLSGEMVAYRVWRTGKISSQSYRLIDQQFSTESSQFAKIQRDVLWEQRDQSGYYQRHRYRVGEKLIDTTQSLWWDGALTTTKAARVLDVKAGALQTLFDSKRPCFKIDS